MSKIEPSLYKVTIEEREKAEGIEFYVYAKGPRAAGKYILEEHGANGKVVKTELVDPTLFFETHPRK